MKEDKYITIHKIDTTLSVFKCSGILNNLNSFNNEEKILNLR